MRLGVEAWQASSAAAVRPPQQRRARTRCTRPPHKHGQQQGGVQGAPAPLFRPATHAAQYARAAAATRPQQMTTNAGSSRAQWFFVCLW